MQRMPGCLLLCFFALIATSAARTIKLADPGGVDVVTYPPGHVNEVEIRLWLRFSPNLVRPNSYPKTVSLKTCIPGNAFYKGCGRNADRDRYALENAAVSLRAMRGASGELEGSFPEDLAPIVKWARRAQAFFTEYGDADFRYLKTGDVDAYVRAIKPRQSCSAEVQILKDARPPARAFSAEASALNTCMINEMWSDLGPYPKAAWSSFLAKHGIVERYVPTEDD